MMEMSEYVSLMYERKLDNMKEEMNNYNKLYENLPIDKPLNETGKEKKASKKEDVFQPTLIHNEISEADYE